MSSPTHTSIPSALKGRIGEAMRPALTLSGRRVTLASRVLFRLVGVATAHEGSDFAPNRFLPPPIELLGSGTINAYRRTSSPAQQEHGLLARSLIACVAAMTKQYDDVVRRKVAVVYSSSCV